MMGQREHDAAKILIDHYQIPLTVEEYLKERNAGHVSSSAIYLLYKHTTLLIHTNNRNLSFLIVNLFPV